MRETTLKEHLAESEAIKKKTEEFLARGGVIEVLPPCMPPSIPEPGPITIRFNQRKKPQVDRRKIGVDKDKVEWKYSADTKSAILDGHKFGKLTGKQIRSVAFVHKRMKNRSASSDRT